MKTTGLSLKALFLGLMLISMSSASEAGDRKKSLDFNEQLIEGLNKRPLDSLNSVNDGSGEGRHRHLYRKKTRFDAELRATLRDLPELSTSR